MNLHFTIWIFFYGFLLQRYYATSSSSITPPDSFTLSLATESSTNENSDKLLNATIFNSRDSFSLNNVNTESLHSNSTNEECKSGHCIKDIYTSSNADNSSSASKTLSNFVSTAKSMTELGENEEMDSSDETLESLHFQVNAYSSNDSAVNITSFSSNDNELDSEINSDNNSLRIHRKQMDKVMNNLLSGDNYYNLSAISKKPTLNTTEILLNELGNSEENYTFGLTETEIQPQTNFYNHNVSDTSNVTAYITTPNTQETTHNELDFSTYFFKIYNSNGRNSTKKPVFPLNSSIEMIRNYDSEILSENNSSPLISMNYDIYIGSDEPISKSSGSRIIANDSNLQTSSHDDGIVPVFKNSKYITLNHSDYESSLKNEESKYKSLRMIDTVHTENNTSISPIIFDSSTNVWTGGEQTATLPTNLNIESNTTERPIDRLEISSTLTSEKYDIFAENKQLNEESTIENIDSSHLMSTIKVTWEKMTNNDSLESINLTGITEPINYALNLTEVEAKTAIFTPIPNYSSTLFNSDDESISSMPKTRAKSAEEADLNSYHSVITSIDYIISTTQQSLNDSGKNQQNYFPDVSVSEVMDQNASLSESGTKFESIDARTTLTKSYDINQNINIIGLNESRSTPAPVSISRHTDDIDYGLTSTEATISFNRNSLETSPMIPTVILTEEDNLSEMKTIKNRTSDISLENASERTIIDKAPVVNSTTTESSEITLNISRNVSRISTNSKEYYTISYFTAIENYTKLTYTTDSVPSHKTHSTAINGVPERAYTKPPFEDITTESGVLHHSESVITKSNFYENSHTEDQIVFPTSLTEVILKSTSESVLKDFDTILSSSLTTTGDELFHTTTESHREGKHIPFSSALPKTTAYPVMFNVTGRTDSYPLQTDTAEHNLSNLRFEQIKAEELSPEERTNLINVVVKFSSRNYSKDELMERMAVIHLWLLHAVADDYKNATFNLSVTYNTKPNEIEFQNLPQILYVLPSTEAFLPNISVTFLLYNKWRNETLPADIILTILNLHAENLKKILVDIEEINFSRGLLMQKPDLISVIVQKYGIFLLSTSLITVGMIFLLACVVIYYRQKTRHSAHCLTDDNLHRNMQEGIDINPAVIILQEEIREKAAMNGNKISSLDGDEGWLAPINDVPFEDNNAPFVQDTKL